MHILITGGTGLIGSALSEALRQRGHHITVLTRTAHPSEAGKSFVTSLQDCSEKVDAVINLAGAGLADRRWTRRYKREIFRSRIDLTRELVQWMATQPLPPQRLLSGSAIGFYGASDDAIFDEDSSPGQGFAADLCSRWEEAATTAEEIGVHVARLRLGVVLAKEGGALNKMTQSFRFGMESWLGSGDQWLSWIHLHDVVRAIEFILTSPAEHKIFNLASPHPVQHRTFAHWAGQCLGTRLKLGVPRLAARLLAGEMAQELLLSGQRVLPVALCAQGFDFRYPVIYPALQNLLTADA
jgi:uncharacterized protein